MKAHKKEKNIKSNEIIYIYSNSSIWNMLCITLHQWADAEVGKNTFLPLKKLNVCPGHQSKSLVVLKVVS